LVLALGGAAYSEVRKKQQATVKKK
jgi:hypothetical protein